jgi:hypothetical protein
MNANQHRTSRSFFHALLPQIILLSLISVLYSLSLLNVIPSPLQLNRDLLQLFTKYGLPLIALSSFLENLVGFNAYFPGAFTILTGMSLTAGHPTQAILTYFIIYVPSYIANVLSYCMGSWRKFGTQDIASPSSPKIWVWFLLTYWHPQLASVTAFSAGVHGVPKCIFFVRSFPTSVLWSVFWAVIIYHSGLIADVARYFSLLFVFYVLIWAGIDTWKFFQKQSLG